MNTQATERCCKGLVACCLTLLLANCGTAPARSFDLRAEQLALKRQLIAGQDYQHAVYRVATPTPTASRLHVYLAGDGRPWRTRYAIADDPSPRGTLILDLMKLDRHANLLLGRPCYHGLKSQGPCTPRDWTSGRYALRIVDSMAAALERIRKDAGAQTVVLIGHSGGGAIAMLLARRAGHIAAVVTIAGNLNTAAWTAYHGYTPLDESLNPYRLPPLDERILQFHLAGESDRNVPPFIIADAASRQPNARFRLLKNHHHGCCWTEIWPEVLSELDRLLAAKHTRTRPSAPGND